MESHRAGYGAKGKNFVAIAATNQSGKNHEKTNLVIFFSADYFFN